MVFRRFLTFFRVWEVVGRRVLAMSLALVGVAGGAVTDGRAAPPPGSSTALSSREERRSVPPYVRFLQGHFDPASHPEFASAGRGHYLHRLALAAYERMRRAARRDGVHLRLMSAARSFARQRRKWNAAWRRRRWIRGARRRARRILRYFAAPGTSRHHWGTDVDLCCAGCSSCFSPRSWRRSRSKRRAYRWLQRNAARFGFCQPYVGSPVQRSGGRTKRGYQEERWHWTYRPLSEILTYEYLRRWRSLRPRPGSFPGAAASSDLLPDYIGNVSCSKAGEPGVSALLGEIGRILGLSEGS